RAFDRASLRVLSRRPYRPIARAARTPVKRPRRRAEPASRSSRRSRSTRARSRSRARLRAYATSRFFAFRLAALLSLGDSHWRAGSELRLVRPAPPLDPAGRAWDCRHQPRLDSAPATRPLLAHTIRDP